MATKAMNVKDNGDGTHTVTFGSSATLNDDLVVALDDTTLTGRLAASKALEAAARVLREQASKATATTGFSTSGSTTV